MSKLTRLILEKLNKGIATKEDIMFLYGASKSLITLSFFIIMLAKSINT